MNSAFVEFLDDLGCYGPGSLDLDEAEAYTFLSPGRARVTWLLAPHTAAHPRPAMLPCIEEWEHLEYSAYAVTRPEIMKALYNAVLGDLVIARCQRCHHREILKPARLDALPQEMCIMSVIPLLRCQARHEKGRVDISVRWAD